MNNSYFKNRLVIGTANFSQKYGANPIKIKKNETKKIFKLAKKNKINLIDTADSYLKHKIIFRDIDKNFIFFTKISPDANWVSLEYCEEKLKKHFLELNNNKIETILFHDIKIFFTKNGRKIFDNLELLKKKRYFQKIGFSIYDFSYIKNLIRNYNFDVLQCPYNVLDKRILNSGWFDKLKKHRKEIHIRSIFLQGLLVNKSIYKKKYFKKWNTLFHDWFKNLENNNISPIDYCLSDLLNFDFDKIIIGINNSKNLKEIINFKSIKKNKMQNYENNDLELIDPRNWK